MDITNESKNSLEFVDFELLPDDILLEIFSRLNFVDLCTSSQVCRRWYSLAQSLSLRKKIIVEKHLQPRQFSLLVHHHFHEQLEEFQYLNDNPTAFVVIKKQTLIKNETFFRLRSKCPQLKKLVLVSCGLTYVKLEDMPVSLRHLSIRESEFNPYLFFTYNPQYFLPLLTCLDIGGRSNYLTSQDLHLFLQLKSLRCLFLKSCFRVNNGGIESIVDLIRQLEVLDVENTDISNEGAQTIISNGSNLKELYLGQVLIDDDVFDDMYMDMFLRLQTLCVKYTNISSVTAKKFGKVKKVNFLSCYDASGNIIENGNFVDQFIGCNHILSHSCSY